MIDNAWNMLKKYYSLFDVNPIYFAAVAIHPGYKFDYFNVNWADRPDWLETAKRQVKNIWENQYKTTNNAANTTTNSGTMIAPAASNTSTDTAAYLLQWQENREKRLRKAGSKLSHLDAMDRFQHEYTDNWEREYPNPTNKRNSVIRYWVHRRKSAASSPETSSLAQMALNVLVVSPMSAEPERVFSSAGRTLSPRRCKLIHSLILFKILMHVKVVWVMIY
ncbi:MAG: hAT transposon family protein [Paenibacillus sp.]|uniref:hAT transposon family protein n=1 Tax=Paenibacillus sp. TaxID=58172 RepID=UPI003B7FA143